MDAAPVDLRGRNALVTGANGGLGYAMAKRLGAAGASVCVGVRNPQKGADAVARLRREAPQGSFEVALLDVASLESVRAYVERRQGRPLDLLVANAGMTAATTRQTSIDGFELVLATNLLGHVALTAGLMDALLAAPSPRVVTVSSLTAYNARLSLDDLQLTGTYTAHRAYANSKLGVLSFALELNRRAQRAGLPLTAACGHPGWTVTNILGSQRRWLTKAGRAVASFTPLGMTPDVGIAPLWHAATAPDAAGRFFGPRTFGLWGPTIEASLPSRARDVTFVSQLFDRVSDAVGVRFDQLRRP